LVSSLIRLLNNNLSIECNTFN